MGQPSLQLLIATTKSMEGWVGMKNLVFCTYYNASTLFQKLQKKILSVHEHCTLQTRYPSLSMVRLSFLCLQFHQLKGLLLSATRECAQQLDVDLCPGKLHLYTICTIIFYINFHGNPEFSLVYKTVRFQSVTLRSW